MKIILLTFLNIFLMFFFVKAQQEIDSLLNAFEQTASASQQLPIANRLAALLHREKALEKSCVFNPKTPVDSMLMLIYGGGGTYCYNRALYERGIHYSQKGIEAAKAVKDTAMMSEFLDILGASYIRSGIYDKAQQTLETSLAIAHQRDDPKGIATVYSNMGTLYSYMKKDSLAISLYQKSVKITRTLNDEGALARRLSNLAEAYVRIKQPKLALPLLKESLALDAKNGHADRVAIRQSNLANAYLEMKEYEQAEKYYTQAIGTFRQMDKKTSLAISCYQMGLLKERTLQAKQAATYYQEAEKIARDTKFAYIEKNAAEGLYRIHKDVNPALAIGYLEKAKAMGDSLYKSESEKQVNEFQVKYQTQEKENQLLLNEQKLKTARLIYFLLALMSVLFAVFIAYLLFSVKRRRKQNNQLIELHATKDKLFSIISHDLKSPAMAQKIAIDTMIRHADKYDEETFSMLSAFSNAAEAQLALLQNLMSWASIQTGKMTFNPISFNFSETVTKILALYEMSVKNKQLSVMLSMPENCMVYADRQMINTVVRNLLNNAIKFSNPNDTITITLTGNKTRARFAISDNGKGMPQQQIDNLLLKEKNVSKTGTVGEKGSGLGLIVCKELLERNNSELEIKSVENKGATFSFNLLLSC